MKVSILHISDLHKEDSDNYDNLLQSLKDDCEKYVASGIQKPKIVVISGDLIKGGTTNEISTQYSNVTCFINQIVDFFLDGDKTRIVIVPGNHDIDWNESKQSMQREVDENKKKNVLDLLSANRSIRWSWKDFCFYQIAHNDKYNNRFALFSNFYNGFYGDDYSLNPDEQFKLYDIPQFGLTFIGFNSCYGNDHLNLSGIIKPECISRASEKLRKFYSQGRLLIAVWHHNTIGLPFENNYMDKRVLRSMMDKHIQIGLHGHHHMCQATYEYKNVFEDDKLLIISAGTLYGTTKTLPSGTKRQYNLIEIETEEDKAKITLHSREDKSHGEYAIPSWGEGRIGDSSKSSWNTWIKQPTQPSIEEKIDLIIKDTEQNQDYNLGAKQLLKLDVENLLVRKFLLEYLTKANDYQSIYKHFKKPQNNEEVISLLNAVVELNDPLKKEEILALDCVKNNTDRSVQHLVNQIKY
ncbi:MAG: metallophosphoesterase [Synergistaceae bacterium]|jgi:hypothetical protein|nr:metallophosphoesterase [Synergistaceae bacterium]